MLLDIEQASDYLNIPQKAVHRLCRQGKLAYVRIDDRGPRRFLQRDLDNYIERNLVPVKQPVDKKGSRRISSPQGRRETAGQQEKGLLGKEIRKLCQ